MTLLAHVYEPFIEWLNEWPDPDVHTPWKDLGLREGAPKEAVEAYDRYLEIQRGLDEAGAKA
jgi:hypothetical protein